MENPTISSVPNRKPQGFPELCQFTTPHMHRATRYHRQVGHQHERAWQWSTSYGKPLIGKAMGEMINKCWKFHISRSMLQICWKNLESIWRRIRKKRISKKTLGHLEPKNSNGQVLVFSQIWDATIRLSNFNSPSYMSVSENRIITPKLMFSSFVSWSPL